MKFTELDQKLSYFLDDLARNNGEGDYQFPLPLRIDGWNSAQETFGAHTLMEKTVTLTVPRRPEHDRAASRLSRDGFDV